MFNREMQVTRDNIKSLLDLIPVLNTIERQVTEDVRNIELMADVTFLTRKCKDILENVERKLNAIEKKCAENACTAMTLIEEKKYSTENCTVSNNSDYYVKTPTNPTDEGFVEFIKQLPPECVRPHFPTVMEKIVEAVNKGEQIPFGLPKHGLVNVNYKLRLTTKKDF